MKHARDEKRVEAGCGDTFSAHDHVTAIPLEPRTCMPGMDARDGPFDGAPRGPLVFHTQWGPGAGPHIFGVGGSGYGHHTLEPLPEPQAASSTVEETGRQDLPLQVNTPFKRSSDRSLFATWRAR